jgi:hypothetical protein
MATGSAALQADENKAAAFAIVNIHRQGVALVADFY